MSALGSTVAIIDSDGRVLLTKRHDFEVWCLPGGHVDEGEGLAATAVREAFEETGLVVELTRLIGLYSTAGLSGTGLHIALFAARPVGGQLQAQASEVIDIGFFAPTELPTAMLWHHHQLVNDALAGHSGIVRSNMVIGPLGGQRLTRDEIYARRDQSGLARAEFYQRFLVPFDTKLGADLAG